MNAVDTTNGYVLEKNQIEAVPLPTGSFTGLAILSPGVNAELPSGTGANSRPGQPADLGQWPARHQQQFSAEWRRRQQPVQRQEHQPGGFRPHREQYRRRRRRQHQRGAIQSTASPYLAIGQALPTPAPETVQELRVNTSMYDAQQGSTSGAHIDMSTASGTNTFMAGLHPSRNRLAERRAVFLQAGPEHSRRREESRSCIATRRAERSAAP